MISFIYICVIRKQILLSKVSSCLFFCIHPYNTILHNMYERAMDPDVTLTNIYNSHTKFETANLQFEIECLKPPQKKRTIKLKRKKNTQSIPTITCVKAHRVLCVSYLKKS